MRDNKSNNRTSSFTFMHFALIMLCLVLLTSHFIGGMYAAYISESGSDSGARVIYFGDISIEETTSPLDENNELVITPGVDIQKKVTVSFKGSESSTYVFTEIDLKGGWAYDSANRSFTIKRTGENVVLMQWFVADGWNLVPGTGADGKYAFYQHLAPNKTLESVDIIKDGIIDVTSNIYYDEIASLSNVKISLKATVVQSIGFSGAQDAWQTISEKGE